MDPLIVFLQAFISGVSIGCIYALVALGFVLIYKATEVVDFAQGELMMVGAFFAYTLIDLGGIPFVPGVLLALIATAAFGVLLNRLLLLGADDARHVYSQGGVAAQQCPHRLTVPRRRGPGQQQARARADAPFPSSRKKMILNLSIL
jgi:hypothetical protein